MSTRDCGYCQKLFCGGEIYDKTTFFTLTANLLCDLGSALSECVPEQLTSIINTTWREPTSEELDTFKTIWPDFPLGANVQVLPPDGQNSMLAVPLGSLPPGIDYVYKLSVYEFTINIPTCYTATVTGSFDVATGIEPCLPGSDPFPLRDYRTICTSSPSYPNYAAENGTLADNVFISQNVPAFSATDSSLTYLIFWGVMVASVPDNWACSTFNGDPTLTITLVPVENECVDTAINVHVCNYPTREVFFEGKPVILCDDNGPFLRHYRYDENAVPTDFYDTEIGGSPYEPVGNIVIC